MKILVTGSTGFVGKELVSLLSENCDFVCPVRKLSASMSERHYHRIGDIDGSTDWSNSLKNVDVVIHLAGKAHVSAAGSSAEFRKVNVDATLNLAKQSAYAGVKRFVFASSIGVNGSSTQEPFTESSVPNPLANYAQSKYEAEKELKKLSEDLGLQLVIVRPPLVYGSNAPGNFGTLLKLVSRLPVLPFGRTANLRSFVSVSNLAHFLYTCAMHPKAAGETFLVSDGKDVSTKELTNAISKGLGMRRYQFPMPVNLMYAIAKLLGKGKQAEQVFSNLQVDSSKAREVLGWVPSESMSQAMAKLKK